MKRFNSIKKNKEFKLVYDEKHSYSNNLFVMFVYYNIDTESNRLGISVSKKVGNSVIRHKVKRRIREIFLKNINSLKNNYDIVLVCKKEVALSEYSIMNDKFIKLCKKLEILEEEKID